MRLLIVEDETKVADSIALGLTFENFAVDVAYEASRGLELASTSTHDLIIVDLMLPGMSGTELIRRIRGSGLQVPLLVLTALSGTVEKVKNFEAGADDYLTKPFAFAELLVRIRALLRRSSNGRSTRLLVHDLELDRLTQTVRRAGDSIDLTAKEYALLEYFMLNPGRTLSRSMIMEHVWDESFEGLTNIVDVYVRHLRQKVDDPYSEKLLRTVRGTGYMLASDNAT